MKTIERNRRKHVEPESADYSYYFSFAFRVYYEPQPTLLIKTLSAPKKIIRVKLN